MMYTHTAIAVLAAALSAGYTWKVAEWKFQAKENEHAQQILDDVRLSAAAAIRRTDAVITSQNEATARNRRLRSDADASRTELERLRDALSISRATSPPVTGNACPDATAPIKELFSQCAGELTGLAEIADRHASDLKLMQDAWHK